MGCGACFQTVKVVEPSHKHLPISIILSRLIDKYQQDIKGSHGEYHQILTKKDCIDIKNLIASSNNQLPKPFVQKKQAQSSPAQNKCGQNIKFPLLSPTQQGIWKAVILIPVFIHNSCLKKVFWDIKFDDVLEGPYQEMTQKGFYQISLDVNRTFPSIIELKRTDLSTVLKNIVVHLPELGYTQGMNFYVGFLLLCGFSAQQSFYLFFLLFTSKQYFLCQNFSSGFSQVIACNQILSNKIPKQVKSHLEQNGIIEEIYCFSWFLCCFLYSMDLQICILIWDSMIKHVGWNSDGSGVTYALNIAIVMMQMLGPTLLSLNSPEELLSCLKIEKLSRYLVQKNRIDTILQEVEKRAEKGKGSELVNKRKLYEMDKQLKCVMGNQQEYEKYLHKFFSPKRSPKQKNDNINIIKISSNEF